jgi:Amt family ammonium transporter
MIRKMMCGVAALGGALGSATVALAQAAPVNGQDGCRSPATAEAGMVNKGDVSWMLVSSALVLLMSIPALALFYGGLVRAKNMLSVLMQVLMIVSVRGAGVGVLGLFDGLYRGSGALALRGGFSVP